MDDTYNMAMPAFSDEPSRLNKLICKLRWIGMEEEARQLQIALLLSRQRNDANAFLGPFNTD